MSSIEIVSSHHDCTSPGEQCSILLHSRGSVTSEHFKHFRPANKKIIFFYECHTITWQINSEQNNICKVSLIIYSSYYFPGYSDDHTHLQLTANWQYRPHQTNKENCKRRKSHVTTKRNYIR